MQRLVGVRRRELHHNGLSSRRKLTEITVGRYLTESFIPEFGRKAEIQEALDYIE